MISNSCSHLEIDQQSVLNYTANHVAILIKMCQAFILISIIADLSKPSNTNETQPFPTLNEVLLHVDSRLDFNLEVKHPLIGEVSRLSHTNLAVYS